MEVCGEKTFSYASNLAPHFWLSSKIYLVYLSTFRELSCNSHSSLSLTERL